MPPNVSCQQLTVLKFPLKIPCAAPGTPNESKTRGYHSAASECCANLLPGIERRTVESTRRVYSRTSAAHR